MRGVAGPVPPSWSRRREQGVPRQVRIGKVGEDQKSIGFEPLPGTYLPEDGSLVATALKGLAADWKWHTVYDQFYLATIPVRYKEVLLYYISCYNPQSLDKKGLNLLFLDETELGDATGTDDFNRLDLSKCVGQPLKLSEIKDLFMTRKAIAAGTGESDSLLDDWDTPEFLVPPSTLPRLNTLTHLSLSQPSGVAIWRELLDLAPHLTTLTHLALAYWPTPTLSPNATTAFRETPQGNVDYGATNIYSAYDNDWSEAASLLRRLGKSTYSLKWLDLTGCYPWVQALASENIDWCGAWQALEIVKIRQGWIPECFHEDSDEKMWQAWRRESRLIVPSPRSKLSSDWAVIEHSTLQIQDQVNALIIRAALEVQSGDVLSQPRQAEADWSDLSRESSKPRYRSTRVVFERGWDAWWIREAINQLAG